MSNKKYDEKHGQMAELARKKAEQNGQSQWMFPYRGQEVFVTGRRDDSTGKVRVSTTHVKNKGK